MESTEFSWGRGLIFVLGIVCLGLMTTLGVTTTTSSLQRAKLRQAQEEIQQLRAQRDSESTSRVDALEKLLKQQSTAYAELQNRYAAAQRSTNALVTATAAPKPVATNDVAANAPPGSGRGGDGGGAWLDRMRTEDPERYKQIQDAREQRRQQMAEYFNAQQERLDERYQTAASEDEASLVSEISETMAKLDELRQRWREVRELPEEERRDQARALGMESYEAYQKLVELRQRDRVLQLNQVAQQLGYSDQTAARQFVDNMERIYKETDTNPSQFMGMGRGFRGPESSPPRLLLRLAIDTRRMSSYVEQYNNFQPQRRGKHIMATDKANRSATDQLREQATVIGEDVQELGRVARQALTEKYEQGLDRATQIEKSLEGQIKANPLRSVLIAAGAGLVIGIMLGRR